MLNYINDKYVFNFDESYKTRPCDIKKNMYNTKNFV